MVAGVKVTSAVQLLPLFNELPQVFEVSEKFAALGPVIWKPGFAIGAPPELLIVRVRGALVWPTSCEPNARCAGATEITGGCRPVPESATVWVCIASETVRTPGWLPGDAGVNITLMSQLALPIRVVPQLLVDRNPWLALIEIEVSGRSPLLVSVTICDADCCPTMVPGKFNESGESPSVGVVAPLPLSATVWVPALSMSVSIPEIGSACVGLNVIEIAQSLLGASEVPHALFATLNGGVTEMDVSDTVALVAFSTVTDSSGEVVPICTLPKFNVPGDAVTGPALAPFPDRGIVIWPPGMLALIVS